MFIDALVAGNKLSALVDTGASDLFIFKGTSKTLGILATENNGWIKTVNSKEVPTCGTAQGVELQLGDWSGKVAIEVIPLDDYDFVIGLGFLNKVSALLVPFEDYLCILDPRCQCIVPIRRESGPKRLSVIQLSKGQQQNEQTTLRRGKAKEEEAPPSEVMEVLSPKLPNWHQSNEGVAGLSGGECHKPRIGGAETTDPLIRSAGYGQVNKTPLKDQSRTPHKERSRAPHEVRSRAPHQDTNKTPHTDTTQAALGHHADTIRSQDLGPVGTHFEQHLGSMLAADVDKDHQPT